MQMGTSGKEKPIDATRISGNSWSVRRSTPVCKQIRIPNSIHLMSALLLSALAASSACSGGSTHPLVMVPSATPTPTASAIPTPIATATATAGSHLVRGLLQHASFQYAIVVLSSGQVLIAGGANNQVSALPNAEIYDPVSGTMRPTLAPMHAARQSPVAVLLTSGKVLIAGGRDENFHPLASAETYDPASDTFTLSSGAMSSGRFKATANLLGDSTVLVAGGTGNSGHSLASADIYDPATDSFTTTSAPMTVARADHEAVNLPDGSVLLSGGVDSSHPLNRRAL
jgi:hypothetical protein